MSRCDIPGVGTIGAAARRLLRGEITSEALINAAFARIRDPEGQGALAFTATMEPEARRVAAETDRLLAVGLVPSPIAGLPISVKDLFDVTGAVTRCGSRVLEDQPAAAADADVISRLRRAGAVIVGRTNMTEFAYSGLGLNPHFGTPLNPYDRETGHIPGGSSSGAAVSVSDGMCIGAIGSDTGGSVRIPAALCGLVGFKPTQRRVSLGGVFPLSPSLDTVGPIARSVPCCAQLDAIIAQEPMSASPLVPALESVTLGILQDFVFDDVQPVVADAFDRSLAVLSGEGTSIREVTDTGFLHELPDINANGGIVAAESYHLLHKHIERGEEEFDPRVLSRVRNGERQTAKDYLQLLAERRRLMRLFDAATWPFDAVVCPTVPWVAPRLKDLAQDDTAYFTANRLMLRNPTIANFMDRPAISIPCHRPGDPPVGLMIIAKRGADRELLGIACAVETALSRSSRAVPAEHVVS